MNSNGDYFVNHYRADKFPFSLYHNPLMQSLQQFLNTVANQKSDAEIAVIGPGLMHELRHIPPSLKLTLIDIDQRVVTAMQKLNHPCIKDVRLVMPDDTLSILHKKFDAIYAKEVIEHIVPWQSYLNEMKLALVPKGYVWLSTPNYGEPWLPLIENTLLEILARFSGYSRKNIHPSRFSMKKIADGLRQAGFGDVNVKTISSRLALVATARS